MKLIDFLILAVVAAVVGLVMWYMIRSKKRGVQCIGCPDSGKCAGNCSACSGCKHKQ